MGYIRWEYVRLAPRVLYLSLHSLLQLSHTHTHTNIFLCTIDKREPVT